MKRTKEYQRLFKAVQKLSNKYDLMGLIAQECPLDEYDSETAKLLPIITKTDDETIIAEAIAKIYTEMFNTEHDAEWKEIKEFAREIKKYSMRRFKAHSLNAEE